MKPSFSVIENLVRPEVRQLVPYTTKYLPRYARMDSNENPFPWPEKMRKALYGEELALNRYPDGMAEELKKAIAAYVNVSDSGILTGNGSDELVQTILLTFGGLGKSLVLHPPTFGMYRIYARLTGTAVADVPLLPDLTLDTEGMLKAALKPEANVVIICSPNNPTGSLFPQEDILRLTRESGKIIVVDEAYAEFVGETLVPEIKNYPNLIIMRTFSKSFGMAGLRLGYLLGQPEVIDLVNRVRAPFNVNTFSQRAGILALEHLAEYREQIRRIMAETGKLFEGLSRLPGVVVYPTRTNFILFQPPDSDGWAEALLKEGFLVRNLGDIPVLGRCLRISAGLPEENERFLQAVQRFSG